MTKPAQSNGFDPDKLQTFVKRLEGIDKDLASEKGSYMRTCQGLRGAKNDVLDEAKAEGIPKKELKAVLKTRHMTRQLEAIRDALEGDQQDTYDMIRHALGMLADLPLGQAALGDSDAHLRN